MCGQSDKSTSQHSSTGPSNNTGSTSLSQNQYNNPGGYSRPFQHLAAPPPMTLTQGMTMATMGGPQGVQKRAQRRGPGLCGTRRPADRHG